jgi:FKBP-type peptidyl-prolyl cis-trans isomerase
MHQKPTKTPARLTQPLLEPLEPRRLLSTSTNLHLSPSTLTPEMGQNLTLTAALLPAKTRLTAPTGFVRFFDSNTVLGKIAVGANDQAALTLDYLYKGNHPITAKYTGDSLYANSASNIADVTIAKPTTTVTSDGLQYAIITPGSGSPAVNGNGLTLNYYGYLNDGTEFDGTNLPGGIQFNFHLGVGRAIPGFDQGLQGMQIGETRVVVIPDALGYGATAQPATTTPPRPGIPANSRLTFIVQLVANDFVPSQISVTVNNATSTPLTTNEPASTANGTAFPSTPVGTPDTPLVLNVFAGTSAPLNLTGSGYAVGGDDPADFVPFFDAGSGIFTITFNPTATGPRSAVVKIYTTDPKTPIFRILVTGTGT